MGREVFNVAKRILNRANGWQRIGLLISIAWVLYIGIAVSNQYDSIVNIHEGLHGDCPGVPAMSFVQWSDAKSGRRLDLFHSGERSLDCTVTSKRANLLLKQISDGVIIPTRSIEYGPLVAAMFFPVAIFWLLSYMLIWLFKWVRDGFRRNV
jgi:hypothetical protein